MDIIEDSLSVDLEKVFLESPLSNRWQFVMIAIGTLLMLENGFFPTSVNFYQTEVAFYCAEGKFVDGNNSEVEDVCESSCNQFAFNYTNMDISSSIQETFNLVCDRELLLRLHGTCFFLGQLLGSLIGGFASDRIGRAKMMKISYLVKTVCGVTMALSDSFICHLVAWCFIAGINTASWIFLTPLISEISKKSRRHIHVILLPVTFSIGSMLCALVGFLLPNWRHMILAMSGITFVAGFLLSLALDESPRWLWTKERYAEVFKIIQKGAKLNKCELDQDLQSTMTKLSQQGAPNQKFYLELVSDLKRICGIYKSQSYSKHGAQDTKDKQYSFIDIFRYKVLTIRILLMCVLWICANTLFYGVFHGASLFDQNIYLYIVIQGVGGVIGSVLGAVLLSFLGRKMVAQVMISVAGLSFFSCIFIPPNWEYLILSVTFLARVSMELFFMLCFMWTAEIMPTVVRPSAISFASMIARVVGLAIPFIYQLETLWTSLPMLFYSLMALLSLIACAFLPETQDKVLANTMEEGNQFEVGKTQTKKATYDPPKLKSSSYV